MEQKLFTKNFTLLVLGQASSLFGNYILRLALSMYVLEVTGSAAVFAGILSIATIPTILLSPVGGILADRADRRNIMVALDTLTGISVLCAAVFLSWDNAVVVISALLVILSVLGAFETPMVFPIRRDGKVCCDCCYLLRYAGRNQYFFYFCGIHDPAEYAG